LVHIKPKRTPPHIQTLNINKHDKANHHPQPTGREDRASRRKLAPSSPTLSHTEAATRCRTEQAPELLHHGAIILELHIQESRSLRAREASEDTPNSVSCANTDPGLCVGASPHPPPHPPPHSLPRTQISKTAKRAAPPPQLTTSSPQQPARQPKTSSTHGPSAPSRRHRTSAPPPTPLAQPKRFSRDDASNEGATPVAPSLLTRTG
jgi:hypothetical protein